MEQRVIIRICSRLTQYTAGGAERETIEYRAEGRFEARGGLSTVSYRESEEAGMGGVETRIVFGKSSPRKVTILRKGARQSTMVFDAGRTTFCTYDTGVMPLSLTILTQQVDNRLTENGGRLTLVYDLALQGETLQHTVFTMDVKAEDDR